MGIILFEDEQVTRLSPVSLGRSAFAISCGSFRLIDVVGRLGVPISWRVRPHLRNIVAADFSAHASTDESNGHVMLVNASLVPSVETLTCLRSLWNAGEPAVVYRHNRIAAAVLPKGTSPPGRDAWGDELIAHIAQQTLPFVEMELALFEYPHDIVRHHLTTLGPNLSDRLANGSYREIADGVFAAEGAVLGAHVVSDSSKGPIVLEQDARIGPYCYLSGPVHIGRSARVIEHAAIKDAVALGHTTKIGGEVEAAIVEPYTNKQHHGFIGHSYLGSWINLGAGTCNSDLKNTYGPVNMEYQGQKVPTGMQFIGCIVGDYAKSAINTGIFTGKTIGVCSMVYGFVTTNVPSFVNYARLFGQVTETPVEVLIPTQARMFARRNVQQRECDVQLLRDMYDLTRHERQLAGEPLIL